MDILGKAILDYHRKEKRKKLYVFDAFEQKVEMDTAIYFRDFKHMPEVEKIALEHAQGKTLDIGAGAGSHALYLQEKGLEVAALDISERCCEVMVERGVKEVYHTDFFDLDTSTQYQTLLLLMNGIGICEDIFGFPILLDRANKLLTAEGQLIFDSSDIAYMYDEDEFPEDNYYGEYICAYGYNKEKTPWFSWLYLDFDTMSKIAHEHGWKVEKLYEDDHYHYLARLTRITS